jgi:hypothetical protein
MIQRLIETKEQELGIAFQERCKSLGLTPELIERAKAGDIQKMEVAIATLLEIPFQELLRIANDDLARDRQDRLLP